MDNATEYWTTRAWRAAEFPAANMLSDARSLARMYAATVGPGSFGHPGSGGSIGFADPGVGFGYVTNLWSYRADDPRAASLTKAVRSCLG